MSSVGERWFAKTSKRKTLLARMRALDKKGKHVKTILKELKDDPEVGATIKRNRGKVEEMYANVRTVEGQRPRRARAREVAAEEARRADELAAGNLGTGMDTRHDRRPRRANQPGRATYRVLVRYTNPINEVVSTKTILTALPDDPTEEELARIIAGILQREAGSDDSELGLGIYRAIIRGEATVVFNPI